MDPLSLSIITYSALAICLWAGITVLSLGRLLLKAKKVHNKMRKTDVTLFIGATLTTTIAFIAVFIWPGLIHMIPSTIAFLEIISIPILWNTTQFVIDNLKHFPSLHH